MQPFPVSELFEPRWWGERQSPTSGSIPGHVSDTTDSVANAVAHDIRDQLQGILNTLSVANRRIKQHRNDDLPALMRHARASARRAATLSESLMAFTGTLLVTSERIDINQVIGEMMGPLHAAVDDSFVLCFSPAPMLCPVLCNQLQLEQALWNVVMNAQDAMRDGGSLLIETLPATLLRQHGKLCAGSYSSIRVCGEGCGIPSRVCGLGLPMVQSIAEQWSGRADIDSIEGKGTVVTLHLPTLGCEGTEDTDRVLPR